ASTHKAPLFGEVVVEIVADEGGAARGEGEAGLAGGVLLVAPAADGAEDRAVVEDEHARADSLGCRALRAHDGHQRHRTFGRESLVDDAEERPTAAHIRISTLPLVLSDSTNCCASSCCFCC